MADDLFAGLPPPSSSSAASEERKEPQPFPKPASASATPALIPALKSSLKRPKPIESNPQESAVEVGLEKKKLKFKMTTDASEQQVIDAMTKITSHISNQAKFSKASKLAVQLIKARSVKPETADHFFTILEAAMSSSTSCTDPSVRADYHSLFSAANDISECLNKKQKNQLSTWTIMAVVANDLFTDDSFMFSKTAARVKELISNLPVATQDDEVHESVSPSETENENDIEMSVQESDPFGLDALIPNPAKKSEMTKGRKETASKVKENEESKRLFLKSQREALITCLEIAARRYKTTWCQTVIDILVKHAFDYVSRFTSGQREAIEKLWGSIKEQQTRRKQGKSVSGKLDVNGFELLQQKYAAEKISIRRAVGGSGSRSAQQWLG